MSTNFWSYSLFRFLGFGSILELENKLNIFDRFQCELSLLLLNLLTRYFGDVWSFLRVVQFVTLMLFLTLHSLLYTLLQLLIVSSDSQTFLWANSFNMDAFCYEILSTSIAAYIMHCKCENCKQFLQRRKVRVNALLASLHPGTQGYI